LNSIKQLARQTAVYGMGTIVPRFLNYALMTPFYTRIFKNMTGYGVITEMYAYMAILLIILTYGMETSYFRHTSDPKINKRDVYDTSMTLLFTTSTIFIFIMMFFTNKIASVLEYPNHPEYIRMFVIIVGIDAFTAIPFARLRMENKAFKFAMIKIINVLVIISTAFFLLYFSPKFIQNHPGTILNNYFPGSVQVKSVFVANLLGSLVTLILLIPLIFKTKLRININLLKKLLWYAFPLLLAGFFGVLNDSFDKAAYKYLLPHDKNVMVELGIYGANFKIAVLMGLIIQMFRYAAEPFFFSKANKENAKNLYARVMNYFVFFCLIIFLGITFNLSVIRWLIPEQYWTALNVIPILLFSYIFYGIFVNLSVWYKLNDLTKYAALLTFCGAVVTIFINIKFVPIYGYYASAWGHFFAYLLMILISWLLGRKFYKISYQVGKIVLYTGLAFLLFLLGQYFIGFGKVKGLLLNNFILLLFVSLLYFREIKGKLAEFN